MNDKTSGSLGAERSTPEKVSDAGCTGNPAPEGTGTGHEHKIWARDRCYCGATWGGQGWHTGGAK